MDQKQFKQYLEENSNAYSAWGEIVLEKIVSGLERIIGSDSISAFLKIAPSPRLKTIESALGKIGRKKYDNPLEQITDIVGVRFVVLLSEQIDIIANIIKEENDWDTIKSRDFLEEINRNPKLFDYQSQHYEIRPKKDFKYRDVEIKAPMCCEVQIRTLLQHAYAELVHNSIYKPVGPVPKQAERQVAKSMALMETTDDLFCSTMKILTDSNKPRNDLLDDLKSIYREKIGGKFIKPDEKTNFAVLDQYRDYIKEGLASEIMGFMEGKKYISLKIQKRSPSSSFFSQPVALFVYWMIHEIGADEVYNHWPLPGYWNELNVILSDLDIKPTHA